MQRIYYRFHLANCDKVIEWSTINEHGKLTVEELQATVKSFSNMTNMHSWDKGDGFKGIVLKGMAIPDMKNIAFIEIHVQDL